MLIEPRVQYTSEIVFATGHDESGRLGFRLERLRFRKRNNALANCSPTTLIASIARQHGAGRGEACESETVSHTSSARAEYRLTVAYAYNTYVREYHGRPYTLTTPSWKQEAEIRFAARLNGRGSCRPGRADFPYAYAHGV